MVTLIINADDFGMNEGRTKAILEFMRDGLVSNTTLMVNMPYAQTAVAMAREQGVNGNVGLHLNLTQGRPLTGAMARELFFCDADGNFTADFHRDLKCRLWLPPRVRSVLRDEMRAQIERYLELGLTERHLDSHHHVHTDFSVMCELLPLLEEYQFRSVRLSANFPSREYGFAKRIYKRFFNARIPAAFKTSHYFSQPSAADACWGELEGKTVELMVHPMRCRDGAGDDSDPRGEYETTSDYLEGFLGRHTGRYRLIGYGDILPKAGWVPERLRGRI